MGATSSEPSTKSKPKWKNLGVRFFSAIALLFIALVPFYFGGWVWAFFVALIGSRMLYEWVRMSHTAPRLTGFIAPIMGLIAGIVYVMQFQFTLTVIAVLATLLSVAGLQAIRETPERGKRIGWAVLGVAYIVIPCLLIISLRGHEVGFSSIGFQRLIFIIFCVAAADVGAYFGGSIIGGAKLAPRISPNKTWSGFFSGQLLAVVMGSFIGAFVGIGWVNGALLALPVAILSVLGDLFESAVKRQLGVKDTGTLIPGHGGFLDRLDSLMAAVFGAAIVLAIFPQIWAG